MEPQQFVRKPQPVMAVQFDGTTAGAYALLGWFLGVHGTAGHFRSGIDVQGPDGPVVLDQDGRDRFVLQHEWVVVAVGGGTRVLSAELFAAEYETAPQAKPQSMPHPGHHAGCRCTGPRDSIGRMRGEVPVDGLDENSRREALAQTAMSGG